MNGIEGEKSDDDYDFWIDDDVESQSDDDVTKVKENVVKEREKRGRLARLLQACRGSSTQRSVEYDELRDECQDSENATSPSESEEDERDGKKHSKISYPRFNSSVRPQNVDLEVGLQFADKKQFRSTFENYRIMNGFNIKIITSDKHRFQAECMGGGCEWRIWASECRNEKTFQIRAISKSHNCIPFSFEKGQRTITSFWIASNYTDLLMVQPKITLREFKKIVDQDQNCNASEKAIQLGKNKALKEIMGDYKGQFQWLADYAKEISTKNPGSTAIVTTKVNKSNKPEFSGIYSCLQQLKQGLLEGCRPVLSIDGCFIKGPWKGQILVTVG